MNKFKENLMLKKISVTIFYLLLFQIGTNIILPFIDRRILLLMNPSTFAGVATLSGASIDSFSILTLGISPYILSSMLVQILGMILPTIKRWKEEGRNGRTKIDTLTKIMAIAMAFIQGLVIIRSNSVMYSLFLPEQSWVIYVVLAGLMTVGTLIAIWIAGQITSNGIGNGSSVLILASISSGIFQSFYTGYTSVPEGENALAQFGFYLAMWLMLFFATIVIELLQKPYLIRYNLGTGKDSTTNYNIKFNNAGIMPLLFSSILMSLVGLIEIEISDWIIYPVSFAIVVLFTYMYTYQSINPKELAEDFQINHLCFDGIATKKETIKFLKQRVLLLTTMNALVLLAYMTLPSSINTVTGMAIGNYVQIGGTTFLVFVSIVVHMYDSLLSTSTEQNIEKLY